MCLRSMAKKKTTNIWTKMDFDVFFAALHLKAVFFNKHFYSTIFFI